MTVEVEVYNPAREQFNAQVQGIYESLVKAHLGLPSSASFKKGKSRLDKKLSATEINDLVSSAFAIATRVGQKFDYLKEGTQEPTIYGKAKAAKRVGYTLDQIRVALRREGLSKVAVEHILESVPDISKSYNWQNILDYEMTLALRRKGNWHRILKMKDGRKNVYVLMPEGIKYATEQEAQEAAMSSKKPKGRSAPMKMAANPRKPTSLVVCYETRRCNLSIRDLKKVSSIPNLYKKTKPLVGEVKYLDEARVHQNGAVGRNMCKYCIIFARMADGSYALVDFETGKLQNIDHFKKELGSKDPRGSV